ncbi:MAG: polyhydroxyalkanoic acid synthase [Burkholderiales bacterium]|nr:polyhydroxyalkanoic acid synthase [Burkholderiales bacterium]
MSTEESPARILDRKLHALAAPFTGSLSPVSVGLAWADWAWHLAASPGRQIELAARATELGTEALRCASGQGSCDLPEGEADEDPRFRHASWSQWPFNVLRQGFRAQEHFWHDAARVPGMSGHHAAMTDFFARQWLGFLTPANWLPTNPVVLEDALRSGGAHLAQGMQHALEDLAGQAPPADFVVGRDLAATPGQVLMRNHLVELIRYAPQTAKVHPEPVLIVPSWIMKYYILDLSPHNSLVRWLVGQGHTVYMLSWRNPGAEDAGLTMDDYLEQGVFEPLRAIEGQHPAPVHLMGYCLGGTLAAIAAAAMAGGVVHGLKPLASLTLLAAQTDFSEPGELGLFIDESQIGFLDAITREQGYLSGDQMAGSFQFLHSRDLVWTRKMREYLMGEREARNDLMAWNADTTRLPARMHHEYLTALYLRNALAIGRYRVQGQPVSLANLNLPVFLVGTERDHVSPWRSVYQLHRLCACDIRFVLAAGGHNAGIVSEPGHPRRHYRLGQRPAQGHWLAPEDWPAQAESHEGSWWPAWQQWLAEHSGAPVRARALPVRSLGEAPGQYVMQR